MENNQDKQIQELLKSNGIALNEFHNIETLTDSYKDFTKDIDKKKIKFGFPTLDDKIRGLRIQELLTVIAGTGIGKSALALNLLLNFVKNTKEIAVYFSLEMSSFGIAERIYQIQLDCFGYDVEKRFINNNSEFIKQCYELKNSLNNLIVIPSRISVNKIPSYIKIIELLKGKKVGLVCIDYVSLLDNPAFQRDEYLKITDNMKQLYGFAKTLNLAIINISQTSRFDVKGNSSGLNIYSGKGSGEIENSSDYIITLEKVSDDVNNSDEAKRISLINKYNKDLSEKTGEISLMKLSIHKNRRGKNAIIYLTFNKKNLRIKEYTEDDLK